VTGNPELAVAVTVTVMAAVISAGTDPKVIV